ncbi:MAG: serine/threonine protein kinase [Planctomycetes bacterium]|nr:serine/threonine protein kinase [Planctomycetota bacterium]
MQDVEFLALLVHRGLVPRAEAEGLARALQGGAALDRLLAQQFAWSEAQLAKLRRTRAGEIPEIPGYEILAKAGTGGTAEVFQARELATQRVLALKVLKPAAVQHAATRKSFIAEARLLERLQHPALVRCFGVARSGNLFFSRLEFIDGTTVLEQLDREQRFSEEEALRIVLGAAEALRYLGEQGVVHRDVKPGNLMLAKDGRVVLIDLGFAVAEATRCAEDATIGTVAYLSPEQACGGAAADIRSDIYSLGISLFHIVVGRLPFQGSDDRETLRKQVMESLSSRELKGRAISPHLQYFIEKMVAKDAAARYQTWPELLDDIRAQLAGRDDLDFERPTRPRRGRPR